MSASNFSSLNERTTTDTLIIGGGIAGLTAAHTLLRLGVKNIVLVEAGTIGSGATGHSAGMLVCEPEHGTWDHLAKQHGLTTARRFFNEQRKALALVRRIIAKEGINCDAAENELLMLARTPQQHAKLTNEIRTRNTIDKATLLTGARLKHELAIESFFEAGKVDDALSVNPLLFARGFAAALARKGVRIYENSKVLAIKGNTAHTNLGHVRFTSLIRATGITEPHKKLSKYLTTIAVTRTLSTAEQKQIGVIDRDMFIDDEKRSYHYGKITGDQRLLIGYGDVLTTVTETLQPLHRPHIRDISRFLKRAFPQLDLPIEHAWTATFALSSGMLPLVSITGRRALVNGGGTQIGSMVAASYAAHRLVGKPHPLDGIFGA